MELVVEQRQRGEMLGGRDEPAEAQQREQRHKKSPAGRGHVALHVRRARAEAAVRTRPYGHAPLRQTNRLQLENVAKLHFPAYAAAVKRVLPVSNE